MPFQTYITISIFLLLLLTSEHNDRISNSIQATRCISDANIKDTLAAAAIEAMNPYITALLLFSKSGLPSALASAAEAAGAVADVALE